PAGTLNAAPSAITGPRRASCGSRSQFAEFIACQMPVKSGLPSALRGIAPLWARPDTGRTMETRTPAAAITPATRIASPLRVRISPPRSRSMQHLRRGAKSYPLIRALSRISFAQHRRSRRRTAVRSTSAASSADPRALHVPQTTIELAVELGRLARIPVASVTALAGLLEIVGRVPQLLDVPAPHDVHRLETDVSQGLDSGVPFHGIGFDFCGDLIRRQFHRVRACAVVQIAGRSEQPRNFEQVRAFRQRDRCNPDSFP